MIRMFQGGNGLNFTIYAVILLAGFWLRVPHFTPLALIGSDASEYVYCVQKGVFPHSPYVLHYWAGWVLNGFVRLDWGYSALSMVSSLAAIPLFGLMIGRLCRSQLAGWGAALVVTVAPVSIRFAGFQEVYAFQFFWLCLAWWGAICQRSGFLCGFGLGAAFATHSGTLFAIPATLLLFWQPDSDDAHASKPPPEDRTSRRDWLKLTAGFSVPLGLAILWLVSIWIAEHGLEKIGLLVYYLRGAAPSPRIDRLFGEGALGYWGEQAIRTWQDLFHFEVTGPVLGAAGAISLLTHRFKWALPWWLLCLPYLLYEVAMGYSLDSGIYLIFLVPCVAAALGGSFGVCEVNWKSPRGWWHGGVAVVGIVGVLCSLPRYQETAEYRNLLPWIQPHSATMTLCEWVRDNTPQDTLLIQPVDWDPTGLASTLYSERTPLFNDGEILLASRWKPLFTHPVFEHVRSITTEDFERWLDEERPLLSFDADPFRSWGCYWPFVDIDRYETRPILWLDQNHSGSSRLWEGIDKVIARIDIGSPSDEERFQIRYPDSAERAAVELWEYHPALYRIARKNDPPDLPGWARSLQELVPERQRGGVPHLEEDGIGFEYNGEGISFESPSIAGRDHIVRLVLNSGGCDHAVACQVFFSDRWVETGRDMEKIVVEPVMRFTDLYFRIPGRLVNGENLRIRLVPIGNTKHMNAYRVEVATRVPPAKAGGKEEVCRSEARPR